MLITVFTPAYNRGNLLPRLYQSLLLQNFKDFEWLIVDDGSTDQTAEVVKGFMIEEKLDIVYIRKENGGKHTAINRGVKEARGRLIFIVDSDDYLPDNSLDIINEESKDVLDDHRFAGVVGMDSYPDGKIIGGEKDFQTMISNHVEVRYRLHWKGDMSEVWKTDILRKYPFPEYPGEKFVTEAVVWDQISLKYQLKYFNKPIYFRDYQEGGLTSNIRKIHRNSPLGSMLYCRQLASFPGMSFSTRIKAAINYWRYTAHYPKKRPAGLRPLWWMWLFEPVGLFFRKRDIASQMENRK